MDPTLEYTINHIFLPPKLPQKDDSDFAKCNALTKLVHDAVKSFAEHQSAAEKPLWDRTAKMTSALIENTEAGINRPKLDDTLVNMDVEDAVALHIVNQNAGIIIRRLPQEYSFEAFELSPTTYEVMAAQGRLTRCFPGPAIAVHQDRILDLNCRRSIIKLFSELDLEAIHEASPITTKAGNDVEEIRDTRHPMFVTEMLMGILRGIGSTLDVTRIYKHTRDDVLWDYCLQPWRRSPRWLLLRVALQTHLMEQGTHLRYKYFMIYLMAQILETAVQQRIHSDLLFVMLAKINRRILKLGNAVDGFPCLKFVQNVIGSGEQTLQTRWKAIEECDTSSQSRGNCLKQLPDLDFTADTVLSLEVLGPYVRHIADREDLEATSSNSFTFRYSKRISQTALQIPRIQPINEIDQDLQLMLSDVESWVQEHLDTWLETDTYAQTKCLEVAETINSYINHAFRFYAEDPENFSVMVLTFMDLWVALDKLSTEVEPLLLKYSTGFPPSVFDPLLLPKRSQMERLSKIEQYIAKRNRKAAPGYPSIFEECRTAESFAVVYYEQSEKHKDLKALIEADATYERTKKKANLVVMKQAYQELITTANALECDRRLVMQGPKKNQHEVMMHFPGSCKKCLLHKQAEAMTIDIHEWPLPLSELRAKATIFELDVPIFILKWRDTTYRIIVDVLSPVFSGSKRHESYALFKWKGIQLYIQTSGQRLQMVSLVKEFSRAHYSSQKISMATTESICVNNGLQCEVFDTELNHFTKKLLGRCDIYADCTLRLPSGPPYQSLQRYMYNTLHTSNEVIASQSQCPEGLTQHEFYSFASLRAGHRLQWRNIARAVVDRTLSFNNNATGLLIAQSIWQAGCPSSDGSSYRDSHTDLDEQDFGLSLLSSLSLALSSVESNWQGAPAVRTFVALAGRILSFSAHEDVRDQALKFLERARTVTIGWVRDVVLLLHESKIEDELKQLAERCLDLALSCYATFDVDLNDLSVILSSSENLAIASECIIMIHDRSPVVMGGLPFATKAMIRRCFRLSNRMESLLRTNLISNSDGIERAIGRVWNGYSSNGQMWTSLEGSSDRWVTTRTSVANGNSSLDVHFNVLDGSLLVNGNPLSRLSKDYEMHPNYRRLFGEKILEVVPSSMKGMVFETRYKIHDNQIHFAFYDTELVIRTESKGEIHELIPSHVLEMDFPHGLVANYCHWLNVSTSCMEWRPSDTPWDTPTPTWQLLFNEDQKSYLTQGAMKLVDLTSHTAHTMSTILRPLEHAKHIQVIFNSDSALVEVRLPRFNLDFMLRQGDASIESRQFRGMVIDENQTFGSLTGLRNKLVLRNASGSSRLVIIPDGPVNFSVDRDGNHSWVMIDTKKKKAVTCHQYQIDTQLGRLIDNGSLLSRLFKLLLHAITSHCLPDMLTGRTGTEEALHGLSMASTNSFLELGELERDLLELISELTPKREYYPKHLKVMQRTHWAKLSALSQHESFERLVSSILQTADSFETFKDSPNRANAEERKNRGDAHLQSRSAIRNAFFRVDGFGAEIFTINQDRGYRARDGVNNSLREQQVCNISRLVQEWSPSRRSFSQGGNLLQQLESWKTPLTGVTSGLASFGFHQEWLRPLKDFLPQHWCSLHARLTASDPRTEKYSIMVYLATLAYSKHADLFIIETLLGLATVSQLRCIRIPPHIVFDLKCGYQPVRHQLVTALDHAVTSFENSPESQLPKNHGEKKKTANTRRRAQYKSVKNDLIGAIVDHLLRQWPIANVSIPENTDPTYIKRSMANAAVQLIFMNWYCNSRLLNCAAQIQAILDQPSEHADCATPYKVLLPRVLYQPKKSHVTWSQLLENPAPVFSASGSNYLTSIVRNIPRGRNDHENLNTLLAKLSSLRIGDYEANYIHDLHRSTEALTNDTVTDLSVDQATSQFLQENFDHCKNTAERAYQSLCAHLVPTGSPLFQPRLSPAIVLATLAHNGSTKLPVDWKRALVHFGVALTALQHAERLIACGSSHAELLNELLNPGHEDWDPFEDPDWLILEVENGILIRQEQAQIAQQMISPSSGSNSIMQLNMGKGKSSVIVPMVAAKLADGSRLTRVVVLKSLSTQMFQLLINKLGGMLNRRIFVMPISRSLKLGLDEVKQIQSTYEDCKANGGIVLAQPEHLLSFELLGLDYLLSDRLVLGQAMVETQRWLVEHSRDILDESDELLSVRFELIYTMGLQQSIQFSPDRWLIVQHVLGIMRQILLETELNGLEVLPRRGSGFPRTRFLDPEAGATLISQIGHRICGQGLPGIPLWNLPPQTRAKLLRFILDSTMPATEIVSLQGQLFGSNAVIFAVLVLRGLLAGGILNFAFAQKRWRVNYGLDLSRTKLAVPYNAKDSPTARSEFSHPDTGIVLTCLSYYYGGLSEDQIFTSFKELLQSDDAQEEYAEWTRGVEHLPTAFKLLSGVNLSNSTQCRRDLFPLLRFSKGLIDFYTSHIVFPKEMKEFPHKLSSSGWDIGRDKKHPTTGFSGTNDSRYVLPIAVKQCDLPQQLSTNAAVLDCLLRPENSLEFKSTSGVDVLDAEALFKIAVESTPAVRVILDVGAHILELRNEDAARKWLSLVPASDALAAIYFDERNELCVISRSGVKEFLQISPFSKQMDRCLVYLDEAHTRGTDLKMPSNYRAIVTLGPDLTKDRLVQACMRMRQLGKGQSVLFCAPLEVQTKILHRTGKTSFDQVEVADVLIWCIQNTWSHTRKSIPLWATQGLRHYQRRELCDTPSGLPQNHQAILEEEAQSLQQRYGYEGSQSATLQQHLLFQKVADDEDASSQLSEIRKKCQEFGILCFDDSSLHEEQERELQPENEREQQIERLPTVPAHIHRVHPSVKEFVERATLNRFSPAYQPAFSSLSMTSADKHFESSAWPQDLLVTRDFVETVQISSKQKMDNFVRPVHWIISGRYGRETSCVVVSPFEANELLPAIRKYKRVKLHIYSPRLSLSHQNIDSLSYCAVPAVAESWSPPKISMQINLFAGQLYFRDLHEYLNLCRFLGVSYHAPDERTRVECDGFIDPNHRLIFDALMSKCHFKVSPINFLRVLISLRRKGQNFHTSHLGKLLRGDLLTPEHFEDVSGVVADDYGDNVTEGGEEDGDDYGDDEDLRGELMDIDL